MRANALGPAVAEMALAEGMAAARGCGHGRCLRAAGDASGGAGALPVRCGGKRGFAPCLATSNSAPMLAPPGGAGGPRGQCADGDRASARRWTARDARHGAVGPRRGRRCAGAAEEGRAIPPDWAYRMPRGGPLPNARAAMAGLMQANRGREGRVAGGGCFDLMAAGPVGGRRSCRTCRTRTEDGGRAARPRADVPLIDVARLGGWRAESSRIEPRGGDPAEDAPRSRGPRARACPAGPGRDGDGKRQGPRGMELPPALVGCLREGAG